MGTPVDQTFASSSSNPSQEEALVQELLYDDYAAPGAKRSMSTFWKAALRNSARQILPEIERLKADNAVRAKIEKISGSWLGRLESQSCRSTDDKMVSLDEKISELNAPDHDSTTDPSFFIDTVQWRIAHQVEHLLGPKIGVVCETAVNMFRQEDHGGDNQGRDSVVHATIHALTPSAITIPVGVVDWTASSVQEHLDQYAKTHFSPEDHELGSTCMEGGCLTPYQSSYAVHQGLEALKGPKEIIEWGQHFSANAAKKLLDACAITDKNISVTAQKAREVIETSETIQQMVEDSRHPADMQ